MKTVYTTFTTDIIHDGHLNVIKKAASLGRVVAGVFSDAVIAAMDRYPLLPLENRMRLIASVKGVDEVIAQTELSYKTNLSKLRPDYVVHGDDWQTNHLKSVRQEVIDILAEWGGQLIEVPYTQTDEVVRLEKAFVEKMAMPELRRPRLRKLLSEKNIVKAIEAHSGLTGLIAEKAKIFSQRGDAGVIRQFDAMWVSSLCDSTNKGKPDIELVDLSSRLRTIDDIMEVTTKPIILDGDTGGLIEHFVYNVKTLERVGVSAVIIEDKTGLKRNSLFGTEAEQTQDSIDNFCKKISAGKKSLKTKEFMIIARIESLILQQGQKDALARAFAYTKAGADGIMIHSREKSPSEIFEFCDSFRREDKITPIVVVPTTFNTVTEEELAAHGVNIVIYANQLTRSAFPAMMNVAQTILKHGRAKEADDICMPIKEILTLIPEE